MIEPETFAEIETGLSFSASERANPLWLRLKEHFDKQLAQLRGKNDGNLDQFATARLRGEIQLLKKIVALGDEPPPQDGI